jgi:hypothetical protein
MTVSTEIMRDLRWRYLERPLCTWCRHPDKKRKARGLCGSCYKLALDFRSKPTPALANAISFARTEGTMNALEWPIDGLVLEELAIRVGRMAFPWKREDDNPFWGSSDMWDESFSGAQLRLLFHHFSMIDRAADRRARRGRASSLLGQLSSGEIKDLLREAYNAIATVFD